MLTGLSWCKCNLLTQTYSSIVRLPQKPTNLIVSAATLQAKFLQIDNTDPAITAGSRLYLQVHIQDRFNNPTACTRPVIVRMSDGTMFRQLSTDDTHQLLQAGTSSGAQPAATPHSLMFVAEVFTAGPVMVEVCVDGVKLTNSWPKSLLVLPGRPSAEHCVVRGQSKVLTGLCAVIHMCLQQSMSPGAPIACKKGLSNVAQLCVIVLVVS